MARGQPSRVCTGPLGKGRQGLTGPWMRGEGRASCERILDPIQGILAMEVSGTAAQELVPLTAVEGALP